MKRTWRKVGMTTGDNIVVALAVIAVLIISWALSWAVTVGLIWLIARCFSVTFSLKYATGIWLIICFVKLVLSRKDKNEQA